MLQLTESLAAGTVRAATSDPEMRNLGVSAGADADTAQTGGRKARFGPRQV